MRIILEPGDREWLKGVLVEAIRQANPPPPVDTGPEVMTLAEVSEYTRIPEDTLRYWRARGKGGPVGRRRGRRIYYARKDVDAWLASAEDHGRKR